MRQRNEVSTSAQRILLLGMEPIHSDLVALTVCAGAGLGDGLGADGAGDVDASFACESVAAGVGTVNPGGAAGDETAATGAGAGAAVVEGADEVVVVGVALALAAAAAAA